MKRTAALIAAIASALALSGCGFQPIYATRAGQAQVSSQIHLVRVVAPENVASYVNDALNARMVPVEGVSPRYELYVQATERADRLAVQIDATVTRYNYRLNARYWVRDSQTGETIRGVARTITSYNIVNSQYSTLFAERAAIEKAARQLAEEIERDILIRFSEPKEDRADVDADEFEEIISEDDPLFEPRRGRPVDTRLPEELYYLLPAEEDGAVDDAETPVEAETTAPAEDATPDVPDPVVQ